MWDLPGPELEPVSPALAGGFLITEPPGKPLCLLLKSFSIWKPVRPNTSGAGLERKQWMTGAWKPFCLMTKLRTKPENAFLALGWLALPTCDWWNHSACPPGSHLASCKRYQTSVCISSIRVLASSNCSQWNLPSTGVIKASSVLSVSGEWNKGSFTLHIYLLSDIFFQL